MPDKIIKQNDMLSVHNFRLRFDILDLIDILSRVQNDAFQTTDDRNQFNSIREYYKNSPEKDDPFGFVTVDRSGELAQDGGLFLSRQSAVDYVGDTEGIGIYPVYLSNVQ